MTDDSPSLIGDPERDPRLFDDIHESGIATRPAHHNPERDDTNDAHFALAGLSLSAGATSGKGLPQIQERNDDVEAEPASWEAHHQKDDWE